MKNSMCWSSEKFSVYVFVVIIGVSMNGCNFFFFGWPTKVRQWLYHSIKIKKTVLRRDLTGGTILKEKRKENTSPISRELVWILNESV